MNARYLVFVFFFYTFLFNEILTLAVPYFGYEDEALATIAFPLILIKMKHKKVSLEDIVVFFALLGFVLFGLAGSLKFEYQPFLRVVIPDLLICIKFWLCLYSGKELCGVSISKYAKRISFHVKIVTWLYFILTLLNISIEVFPYFDYRYGMGSNRLFYSHPMVLISCCSFMIIILLGIKPYIKHGLFYVLLLCFVMSTTLRSRAIANAVVFLLVFLMIFIRKKRINARTIVGLSIIVGLMVWPQVRYYFFEIRDISARAKLLQYSFVVAREHFPLGAGFGTYGSYYSSVFYSPLYDKYGLSSIYGLSREVSSFICDSFWPMVIGQVGWLGTLCFGIVVVTLVKKVLRFRYVNCALYASAVGAIAYMIVESTAATAFVHPLSMPIALWLGILINNARTIRDKFNEDNRVYLLSDYSGRNSYSWSDFKNAQSEE